MTTKKKGATIMSKMSQLHAELSEQAYELGFESLEEAQNAGYGVDYENYKLIAPQEACHRSFLKEKEELLIDLGRLCENLKERGFDAMAETAKKAVDFIKQGEL